MNYSYLITKMADQNQINQWIGNIDISDTITDTVSQGTFLTKKDTTLNILKLTLITLYLLESQLNF